MISQSALDGYRQLEELVMAAHQATSALPRDADPRLVERLRRLPCAATDSLLGGCASHTSSRRQQLWRQSLALLEQVGEVVDQTADAGWLPVPHALALLEIQTTAVVRVLSMLEQPELSRNEADPDRRAA
jgi:hypothetical protein